MLEERQGDLFSPPSGFSLAHCVSSDLRMSSGIARNFRAAFGNVQKLKRQNPTVGDLVQLYSHGRHIFYLITKR